MNFIPPGLVAYNQQQANQAAQSSGGSSIGDATGGFWNRLLDIGEGIGNGLFQLEVFDRTLEAQQQIANQSVNGGITGLSNAAQQNAATNANQTGGLSSILSDPQTLLIVSVVIVVLILFLTRKSGKG